MDTKQTVISKAGVEKIGKRVTDKLPKEKDISINLRDKVNDVLLSEKHNLVTYQIGINEAINEDLRNLLIKNRNALQGLHGRCFNELFNLGEYQAEIATGPQIADTASIFTNYLTQFPNQ